MEFNLFNSQRYSNKNKEQLGKSEQINNSKLDNKYEEEELHQQQFNYDSNQLEKFDIQGPEQNQISQDQIHSKQPKDNLIQINKSNIPPTNAKKEDKSPEIKINNQAPLPNNLPNNTQPILISEQIKGDQALQKNNKIQENNILLAFKQRRDINRNLFSLFTKKRYEYIQKHFTCYQQITSRLTGKIKETNQFIPYFIKYFNQIAQVYKDFYDGNKKISAFKYLYEPGNEKKQQKLNWSGDITKGVKLLIELKEDTTSMLKNFQNYVSNTTSLNLQKHIYEYNKNVQKLVKEVANKKQLFYECENNLHKRIKRINRIFVQESDAEKNQKNRKDLLQQQLEYFTEMTKSNNALTQWGITLLQWWKEVISSQVKYTSQIKKTILDFFQYFKEIHLLPPKYKQYFQYWRDLNINKDVNQKYSVQSVLTLVGHDLVRASLPASDIKKKRQEQIVFKVNIFDKKQKQKQKEEERLKLTLQDISKFNTLQTLIEKTGQLKPALDYLIVKKFSCQRLQKQKLARVTIASTINQHIIFYDEKQLNYINKMQLKRLLNMRKSQYVVNVNEKIEGFMFDTWNKQVLHFKNSDQAEQFMFYTQNNKELKEKYIASV